MNNKFNVLIKLIKNGYFKLAFFQLFCKIASSLKPKNLYKVFSKNRNLCVEEIIEKDVAGRKIDLQIQDEKKYDNVIWTMWYQGEENAPEIVKEAIDSKINHSNGHKVIIIDKDNVLDYLDIPDFITKKVEAKEMSLAHFSDYVRCSLLYRYGGLD